MSYPRVIHDSGKRYSREQLAAVKADLRAKGIPYAEGPWGVRVDVSETPDNIFASDAPWFETNPRRSYRIREALPDELSDSLLFQAALEGNGPLPQPGDKHLIIVKQIRLGFRIRKLVTIPVQFAGARIIPPDDVDRALAKVFKNYWLAIDDQAATVEIMPGAPRPEQQPSPPPAIRRHNGQIEQGTRDPEITGATDLLLDVARGCAAHAMDNGIGLDLGPDYFAGSWASFVFDCYPASGAEFGKELFDAEALTLPAPRTYCQFWDSTADGERYVVSLFAEADGDSFILTRVHHFPDRSVDDACLVAWGTHRLGHPVAAMSMLDLIACIGALAIRGVERREIRPPRLPLGASRAERRAYERTPKTPPYTVIHLAERQQQRGGREGSHAPKRPHFRRGHVRRLQSGRVTSVSPCFINAEGVPLPEYRVMH